MTVKYRLEDDCGRILALFTDWSKMVRYLKAQKIDTVTDRCYKIDAHEWYMDPDGKCYVIQALEARVDPE